MNIIQHAGARQATIALTNENHHVCLLVADDACGIDPVTIGRQHF